MITVLVVEDAMGGRDVLVEALRSAPDIRVIAALGNGRDAVEFVARHKVDVIVMDLVLPVMGGVEATRIIMSTTPVPIIILGAHGDPGEVDASFRAMEAGAIAVTEKPGAAGARANEEKSRNLIQLIRLMSEIRVVRRKTMNGAPPTRTSIAPAESARPSAAPALVAIGASTGGPVVMEHILSMIRPDFPLPILLVQHIAHGFVDGFVEWLNQSSRIPVRIARHGEVAAPGTCHVAPDNVQMAVDKRSRICLTKDASPQGPRPAVAWLFRSIAANFGARAVGVLLTGMGRDGACELLLMRRNGAVTIAQDRESSVVHGMPGEAIKIGAATHELTPTAIAAFLNAVATANHEGTADA